MPEPGFTIYGTPDGYVAVTNEIRQAILRALEEQDRELPELADITDRAKSTLSSNHMPRLLDQGIVEESPHPRDGRRKIYELAGERLGSSSVPVDELRDAVKDYVTQAPRGARLAAPEALGAIASAPGAADGAVVRAQAVALGRSCGRFLDRDGARRPVMRLVEFLEQEGVAEALQVDLEAPTLTLEPASEVRGPHAGTALAGFVAGSLEGEEQEVEVDWETAPDGRIELRFW